METVAEKYVYRDRHGIWRFEVSHIYNNHRASFSRVFATQAAAVTCRDRWLAANDRANLSKRERHELVQCGGEKARKILDKQTSTSTMQNMDSAYVYNQLTRLENGWLNNNRRISHLEAQITALVERICAAERDIDAIKAPAEARRRTAVRAARKKEAADAAE